MKAQFDYNFIIVAVLALGVGLLMGWLINWNADIQALTEEVKANGCYPFYEYQDINITAIREQSGQFGINIPGFTPKDIEPFESYPTISSPGD